MQLNSTFLNEVELFIGNADSIIKEITEYYDPTVKKQTHEFYITF